ncbi:MAG: hypothetical protein P4L53_13260 [Candidatus Obscuribacterales bacterium]|nr:hypothetical protein [Candidatus Obscuribacterales bacterium]
MSAIALVLGISLGMQLAAVACPSESKFSRKIATRILLGCLAIACFFVWGGPLLSLPAYPYLAFAEVSYIALLSAWPANDQWRFRHCFDLALSLPLGIGAISGLWFAWLLIGGRNASVPFALIMCTVSLAVSVLLLIVRHRKQARTGQEISTKSERNFLIEISACFGGACSLLHIACQLAHEPLGLWDAWMLWNTRAHFLFRSGADWMQQFSGNEMFSWLHPDYPLLLPASVSAIWQLEGYESVRAPLLISGLFTVSVISILMFGVALLRTRNQGYLAGLALMGLQVLYLFGCSQQADVPLSTYMLSALICFALHQVTNEDGLLCLSGTFAGMAAWTKNEGGLFALLFCTLASLGLWATGQTKSSRIRKFVSLAFGLFPWALLLILFKIFLAPETDLFQQPLPVLWARLFAPGRYPQIFGSFINEFKWFGLPFLVFYGLLFGLRFPRSNLIPVLVIAATVFGMFAGYFLVYVVSPGNLSEMVTGSQERLFLQTWPSLLLLFFSVVQTPEDLYRRLSTKTNSI